MTDKLYYESSHRKDFEAQVISCEPEGEGYKVVLDKTVFFPEGGGQYADTGILGGVHVLDAQEKDGIIYHYTDGALTPGEIVKGEIDWEKRFESMQQHSGEHIISGIVHGRFGYNNVGFHLGADYCITGKDLEKLFIVETKEKLPVRELVIAYNDRVPITKAATEFLKYF